MRVTEGTAPLHISSEELTLEGQNRVLAPERHGTSPKELLGTMQILTQGLLLCVRTARPSALSVPHLPTLNGFLP